jgi:amidase
MAPPDYRIIAAEKKLQQSNKIPQDWLVPSHTIEPMTNLLEVPVTCGVLSEVECEITSDYDATTTLEKLKSGTWSAEQVTVAFCKRAAIAQQLVSYPMIFFPVEFKFELY